jgi:hypothetical protein
VEQMKAHSCDGPLKAGVVVFAALLSFVVPSLSLADSINWTVVGNGGVSFAGGTTHPLKGTGIAADGVSDVQSGLTLDILHGVLTFTTGNFTGSTSTQWFFGGNSSPTAITITGCIDKDHDGGACDPQDTAVSLKGQIADATVTKAVPGASFATVLFDLSGVVDSPSVCAALGAPAASCGAEDGGGSVLLKVAAGATPPGGFSATKVLGGDVFDGPEVSEPTTLLLSVFSALGIAWLARRKKS